MELENLFSSDENMDKFAYLADFWTAEQTVCPFAGQHLYIINLDGEIKCFQVTLTLSMIQPNKKMPYMFPANTHYNLQQFFFISHATILLCLHYMFYTRKLCINNMSSSLANNNVTYRPRR
jgi:hypothetical protein